MLYINCISVKKKNKEIILDYLGGPNTLTGVRKWGRGRQIKSQGDGTMEEWLEMDNEGQRRWL